MADAGSAVTTSDLASLFATIPTPPHDAAENVFGVFAIAGYSAAFLGRDREGRPALLVHVPAGDAGGGAVTNLTHITVRHNASCVDVAGSASSTLPASVTLVRCKSSDRSLQQHFLHIISAMLHDFGAAPTADNVDAFIRRIVRLFRALDRPAMRTIQGLWAELFVMARCHAPLELLRGWHRSPFESIDFTSGAERLEVKSFRAEPRNHTFSLAQLTPPNTTTVLVASVQALAAAGGTTIGDLLQELRSVAAHDEDAATHLEETAAACLGDGWREALREGFDAQRATDTLKFFVSSSIPRPALPLPDGISNVHFDVLMSGVPEATVDTLHSHGSFFAAARPRMS